MRIDQIFSFPTLLRTREEQTIAQLLDRMLKRMLKRRYYKRMGGTIHKKQIDGRMRIKKHFSCVTESKQRHDVKYKSETEKTRNEN